ncbi:MAG: alpha/beta fold hydrolase [Acidobacteria bacterium]|nr:alpha/beta fold hydrolase [Acidobacteriota bacterium]
MSRFGDSMHLVFGALLCLALVLRVAGDEGAEVAGHWEGAIEVPRTPLGVKVDLRPSEGAWAGTIDIPLQGAMGLALEAIVVDGTKVSFRIAGIPGAPTFDGRLEGRQLKGTFRQSGASFPFQLGREVQAAPNRPQDPRPPFPYRSEEVSYPGPAGTLAGTLTLPRDRKPIAAVLLISGSGPQNRNGEIFEHRPFAVLADHLSRKGIAVLRVDDRGVGKSQGSFVGSTSLDFAEDARAGLDFLRQREDLPSDRIGLFGHSEGGLIAPLLAAEDPGVAFLVLVAAPAVTGREVLSRQRQLISRSSGEKQEEIERREAVFDELLSLVLSDPGSRSPEEAAHRRDRMLELAHRALGTGATEERRQAGQEQAEALLAQLQDPWFRFFLAHDPAPALSRVQVPVLALYGSKDLQVDPEQNQSRLEAALRRGGDEEVEVVRIEGLNHLMQTAGTGHPSEYWALEETFSPAALERISSWILQRFPEPPATEGESSP